jgi:hypothetical protein
VLELTVERQPDESGDRHLRRDGGAILAADRECQHQQVPEHAVTEPAHHLEESPHGRIVAAAIRPQAQRLLEEIEALPESRRLDVVHAAIHDVVNAGSSASGTQAEPTARRSRGKWMNS